MTTNKSGNSSSAFEESDDTINHELSNEEMQSVVGGSFSSMVKITTLSPNITSAYISSDPIQPIASRTVMCVW